MTDMPARSAPLRDHLAYLSGCYRDQASTGVEAVITPDQAAGMAEYLDWLAARADQDSMPLPENVVPFCQRAARTELHGPGGDAA